VALCGASNSRFIGIRAVTYQRFRYFKEGRSQNDESTR